MEETQRITLAHKEKIEALRHAAGHTLSSHTFASLYLWREEMGLSLWLTEDMFAVRCGWKGKNAWFFPCGEASATEAFIRRRLAEPDFSLCYLRTCDAQWLEKQFPGRWKLLRVPQDDEYLYDVAGHRTLIGGAYANMRTQVHKVEREYQHRTEWVSDDTLDDALRVIRQWSHGEHRFGDCTLRDDRVDEEALLMHRELDITGIVLYLNDEPVAVTAGFVLDGDTFDVAVAKSVSTAQGVPYYAKRELFMRLEQPVVNMEEDLGIPGLRRMKNGMHPVGTHEIWEAFQL